jgi:glutathione S-transferase
LRLLCEGCGRFPIDYEDRRLSREEWLEIKPTVPFQCMPFLEVDGKMMSQSIAMNRYLAKKFELAGTNDWDEAMADMIVDCTMDMIMPLFQIFHAKTDEDKATIKKQFLEEKVPPLLEKLEDILKQNKSGDKYFVGEELTWADLNFFNAIEAPSGWGVDMNVPLEKCPKLKALKQRVADVENVKAWLEKRPEQAIQ